MALFWEKVDFTDYVPLVPTSAHSGDGMGDLISLLVTYSQGVLAPKLMLGEELEAVVLEVQRPTCSVFNSIKTVSHRICLYVHMYSRQYKHPRNSTAR